MTWRKQMDIDISCILEEDYTSKKSKCKNMRLEYRSQGRFENTMIIHTPSGEKIMVDAEFMGRAASKIIEIGKI